MPYRVPYVHFPLAAECIPDIDDQLVALKRPEKEAEVEFLDAIDEDDSEVKFVDPIEDVPNVSIAEVEILSDSDAPATLRKRPCPSAHPSTHRNYRRQLPRLARVLSPACASYSRVAPYEVPLTPSPAWRDCAQPPP